MTNRCESWRGGDHTFFRHMVSIAGFQSHDKFSAWWSTPNGNTFIGSG
jgi:hypothetical protein